MINTTAYLQLSTAFNEKDILLVAVSKTQPVADIKALYDLGQRDFGENYVQELAEKRPQLPADIRWHFIGHLQTNKVKTIAAFVHLVHTVDSFKLLLEINKQAQKHERVIDVLLQLHIADEESKFGLDDNKLIELLEYYDAQKMQLKHIRICGLMGMATLTDDEEKIRAEYKRLYNVFLATKKTYFLFKDHFSICSAGMTGDYKTAIEEGSTMVRIGSMLFGSRP